MKLDWLIEIFKNISVAVIGGGLWFLYDHIRSRTFEKKLLLEIKTFSEPLDGKRVLFVDVELTNKGKGKLKARQVGPTDYVYKDEHEQLKYSCSLQIKRVKTKNFDNETYLDWYKSPELESVPGIPAEINLLDDYIVSKKNNEIEFWMEPGDIVQLSAPLVLQAGHYLLKVSFFGSDLNEDFWSRLFYVHI